MNTSEKVIVRKFVPDENALAGIGTTPAQIGLITELLDLRTFNMGTYPSTSRNLLHHVRNNGWAEGKLRRFDEEGAVKTDDALLFAGVETGLVRSVPVGTEKEPHSLPESGEKLLYEWKFAPKRIDWTPPQERAIAAVLTNRAMSLPKTAEDLDIGYQSLRNTLTGIGNTLSDFVIGKEHLGERKSLWWKLAALHAIGEIEIVKKK